MNLSTLGRLGAGTTAAAMALLSCAATPASAAVNRNPYQVQINLSCSIYYCEGAFPVLGDKERLELDRLICTFLLGQAHSFNAANFYFAQPTAPGGYFHLDMHVASRQGGVNGVYAYVVEQGGPFIVPHNKQLKAGIYASGGPPSEARCTALGEKVITT